MKRFLTFMLLAVTAACGSGASHAGGHQGSAGSPGRSATAVQAPPGANSARVDAIAAVIAKTSNSNDGFVAFRDTSDAVSDGPERLVQMSCDRAECHFEALCDRPPLTCDRIGPGLQRLGLQPDPQNEGVYFVERHGSAADFARLTETAYLTVLGASPGYRLSWRSGRQTSEVPVQT
jgi:hypothetical protein